MNSQSLTSRQRTLLLALAAAGILLRFAAIERSYWFDELATVANIDVPDWKTVLEITSRDNQPPLYNSAIFFWTHLSGFSEIAVRALSVLFGLLALCTPWLARTSLDRTEKLLVFAILCLMPLPIRYAQEARNYSLLFLLSAACLFSYFELTLARSRRLQILFHVSLLLLAFTHLFGLLLAVSFLAVMFWREPRILWRLGLAVYGAAISAAVIVPLLHGGSGQLAGGNFWITFTAVSLSMQLLWVFTPVGIALLLYALILWHRNPNRAPLNPALVPAVMPFVLMLSGSIVISFNTPIVTDRNLIGLVAAFALLTAWFLRRIIPQHPVSALALICLLLLQAAALTYSPYLFIQQDFRSIAQHSIADHTKVCYVVPMSDESKRLPRRLYSFYIVRLLGHPDLAPVLLRPAEVPSDLAGQDCRYWANATLQKRGSSFLRSMPQFAHCADVPLGKPGVRMASELLDCAP
jgi:uncharacterized membrane protein